MQGLEQGWVGSQQPDRPTAKRKRARRLRRLRRLRWLRWLRWLSPHTVVGGSLARWFAHSLTLTHSLLRWEWGPACRDLVGAARRQPGVASHAARRSEWSRNNKNKNKDNNNKNNNRKKKFQ